MDIEYVGEYSFITNNKRVGKKEIFIKSYTIDKVLNTFKDLAIKTLANKIGGTYYGYIVFDANNNLGSKNDNPITLSNKGNFYLANDEKKQPIKLGKILKTLIPTLQDHEIEKYVSKWKQLYTIDTSIVRVSKDISSIYDKKHSGSGSIGGSCMRYKGDYMKIYEDLECQIAYIVSDDTLQARCILWKLLDEDDNHITAYDRIFSSNENYKLTLQSYCDALGYYNVYKNPKRLDLITSNSIYGNYYDDGVPYVDTMYQLNSDYHLTNCNDDYGVLQNTNGTYEHYRGEEIASLYDEDDVWCVDTEEYIHIDTAYYEEYNGEYYSDDSNLRYVENHGYYHEDFLNDKFFFCEYDGLYYYGMSDAIWIENDECYIHEDNMTRYGAWFCDSDGNYYSDSIESIYIEDTGEMVLADDSDYYYYDEDSGYYYSDKEAIGA